MVDIAKPTTQRDRVPWRSAWAVIRPWVTGRRGWVLGGIAVVAAGLALGWSWLTAIGVAPIILAFGPCAAMCAVGACAMMKAGAGAQNPPGQALPASDQSSRQESRVGKVKE